jgi:hypothetical protein
MHRPEAEQPPEADNVPVPDLTRFSVLFGGLLLMGVIMLALRWTWGSGPSLPTAQLPDPDDPTGSGLLVEASRVPDPTAAEVLRGRLAAAGIRATVRRDDDPAGARFYRILVFPDDLTSAKVVLSRGAQE